MGTTFSKIKKAIAPIEEWAMDLEFEGKPVTYNGDSKRRTTNLRFDVEAPETLNKKAQMDEVWYAVKSDLTELLNHGDVNHPDDPFLRAFDGQLVRGKPVKTFEINGAVIYREHKPRKCTYEYTVYLVVYVDY